MKLNKWRLRCTTDNVFEHVWLPVGDAAPTLCPTDTAHTVDGGQTVISEVAGGEAALNADGVALSAAQPQTLGYEMCERDFKIVTCQMTQAAAVEDLKQNPATLKEDLWAGPELSIVGVYKDVAGSMVLCSDQGDADTNGILTIWDYKAIDQADGTTEIPYDIRSGALIPDPIILPSDRFNHRAYIMVAPDLGQANYVRLFDGYVAGRPVEGELSTDSPSGKKLDPALAPGANVVRIYVHHPAGITHSHILYLMTYRPKGTF